MSTLKTFFLGYPEKDNSWQECPKITFGCFEKASITYVCVYFLSKAGMISRKIVQNVKTAFLGCGGFMLERTSKRVNWCAPTAAIVAGAHRMVRVIDASRG